MRITFLLGEAGIDIELAIRDREQTVADVVTALADGPVAAGVGLLVDGTFIPPTATVGESGLREGAVVELGTASRPTGTGAAVGELRIAGGLVGGHRYALDSGAHTVGRHPEADVVLDASTVSARHAQLQVGDDGTVTVEDLGSTNGTRVNGQFVRAPQVLTADAIVQVGAVQLT